MWLGRVFFVVSGVSSLYVYVFKFNKIVLMWLKDKLKCRFYF